MKKINVIKWFRLTAWLAGSFVLGIGVLTVFFDQAILIRKGTFYHGSSKEKLIALTFDDGPSPKWTPQILDALKASGIKATFFMVGEHVELYPDIARRVVLEGHEIENHSYDHKGIFFYSPEEVKKELNGCEKAIKEATGVTTKYFRPPKAWITQDEKEIVSQMGYKVILWSLNAKDWVTFDDKYIVAYLVHHVRPGDIILFHDSGGVFGVEGGDRHETVKSIPTLVRKLSEKGYRFVTVKEMLDSKGYQL